MAIYLIKMKLLYSVFLDGAPPYLYVICHAHTKQVKRLADWIKGGFRGKLEG